MAKLGSGDRRDFAFLDGEITGVGGHDQHGHEAVLRQMRRAPAIDLFADAPIANPRASAYLLAAYAEWSVAGTVFLAIVDPRVGGPRPPIILEADGRCTLALVTAIRAGGGPRHNEQRGPI